MARCELGRAAVPRAARFTLGASGKCPLVACARFSYPVGVTGTIFNIQRFSIHDGPGIRSTVFMKGCPLGCAWCHNPEGRDPAPALSLLAERCIRCGACLEACPHRIAQPAGVEEDAADSGLCLLCGTCAEACPADARAIIGRTWTIDSLVEELERDRVFYEESGGGVTFSGGEPLAEGQNLEFVLAALDACRERGLHRAIDTSGYTARDVMLDAAARADLILYDLKLMDDRRHRQATGVGNALILENLKALSSGSVEVWIRLPFIPGVNDDRENLDATGAFVSSLPRRHPVHLLPFHAWGGDKARRIGLPDSMRNLEQPTAEAVRAAVGVLEGFGLEVRVGG